VYHAAAAFRGEEERRREAAARALLTKRQQNELDKADAGLIEVRGDIKAYVVCDNYGTHKHPAVQA
jgi:hypothetical protein